MTNTVFLFGSPVLRKQSIYRLSPALTLVFYGAELLLKRPLHVFLLSGVKHCLQVVGSPEVWAEMAGLLWHTA